MNKIIANYYLFVILALVVQAIFVVFSGNISIADTLATKTIQAENQVISDRIRVLEDKISEHTSSYSLNAQANLEGYQPIAERLTIASDHVASLP